MYICLHLVFMYFKMYFFFDYRVVKILWHHQLRHRVQFIYAVMTKNGQTEGTDTVEKGLQQLTSQSNTAYFVCLSLQTGRRNLQNLWAWAVRRSIANFNAANSICLLKHKDSVNWTTRFVCFFGGDSYLISTLKKLSVEVFES